jgi:hypothetical protein
MCFLKTSNYLLPKVIFRGPTQEKGFLIYFCRSKFFQLLMGSCFTKDSAEEDEDDERKLLYKPPQTPENTDPESENTSHKSQPSNLDNPDVLKAATRYAGYVIMFVFEYNELRASCVIDRYKKMDVRRSWIR